MTKRVGNRSPSPINQPQGNYRAPYPRPPTYPYPARNRSAEIITISLLVAAFMLLGLGGMLWVVQARLAFGPTPTPTPTSGAPLTATPDFLATRVAEDFLTQQAYQMALLGTLTPTPQENTPFPPPQEDDTPQPTNTPVTVRLPGVNVPFTPTPIETTAADAAVSPLETPTSNTINLPIVVDSSPLATPTPAQVAELPTEEPTVEVPTPEPPTATPTATLPVETATPTPTEILPTPSPTGTPIPPGQSFVVASLQGVVEDRVASLRLGPSSIYTQVNQLEPGIRATILRRNPSGEWLYICCIENRPDQQPVWVRQATMRARNNQLQNGAPEDSNPNDVRYLAIEPPPLYLTPIPTPFPPAPDDFPLSRYDRHGSGRVDQLPNPPLNPTWSQEARAGLGLNSPVAVAGSNILVGSLDSHLYSFERTTGTQRWRDDLCEDGCRQMTLAPMIYENEIFIADQNRTLWAFANPNAPSQLWRVTIAQQPLTSFNIYSDTLFLATGEGSSHNLLALDRDNGALRWQRTTEGPGLRYPVIGDQLVYAADGTVEAYDFFNGELVWKNSDVQNIIAGPVYASPGPSALAELYVVSNNNRIYALDANTGDEVWNIDNGENATHLAINENLLFVAGDGYVKAISRQDRNQRWRAPIIGGQIMGGPLVDANRVLVVTSAGTVHLFDNNSGSAISVPSIGAQAGGGPAVSGAYLFVPGTDGRLYAYVGSQ
jgi:outer membrane protein assembly factor BamB